MEIVRQKYGSHIDTRVYLDFGYGEMEIDVDEIEMIDGELSGTAYCHQREIEMYVDPRDCKRALAKFKEENE